MMGATPNSQRFLIHAEQSVLAVVVNYNGSRHVLQCLKSLLEQSYPWVEIVIVDNNSNDDSLSKVELQFPQIPVIKNVYNTGWGVACNIGMAFKDSTYVALINNDAWLDKNCIEEMVSAIEEKPEYGSCASKILLPGDPAVIEGCGLNITKDGSSCGRGRLESAMNYQQKEEVFCANDCCCLYKREMLKDIGNYDPDFFIYCDETDMGYRHQIAGWKCIYNPKALAYHLHSKAAGNFSSFKAYFVERNRILLMLKYYPVSWVFQGFILSFFRYLIQIANVRRKRGSLSQYLDGNGWMEGAWTLLRAHISACGLMIKMWKRRMEIRKIWRISYPEFKTLFQRFGIPIHRLVLLE